MRFRSLFSDVESKNSELSELQNNARDLKRVATAKAIFSTDTNSTRSDKPDKEVVEESTRKKLRTPSENFLSKIKRFEKLAKGLPSDESSIGQFDNSTNSSSETSTSQETEKGNLAVGN